MATATETTTTPTRRTDSPNNVQTAPVGQLSATGDNGSPNEDSIRELAYSKWEKAGWPESDGVSFWLEAEQELMGK